MSSHQPSGHHDHENKDINVQAVLLTGFGLFMTIVFGLVVAYITYLALNFVEKKMEKPVPVMYKGRIIPPAPHLQTTAGDDLVKMRAEQNAAAKSYGWVDKNTGVVHIPVDRAMELTAERGLPYKEEKKL